MADNLLLFDPPGALEHLLPFTYTRPISTIRVGILTIAEKWEKRLNSTAGFLSRDYLKKKFPAQLADQNLLINSTICPSQGLLEQLKKLQTGQCLVSKGSMIAYRCSRSGLEDYLASGSIEDIPNVQFEGELVEISRSWDIFLNNAQELESDFQLLTSGRKTAPVEDDNTHIYNPDRVFLEEGVTIRSSIINAIEGPVYLGAGAEIQEGAILKGPVCVGPGSNISMGSKIRGNVSLGPYCKVGGEVINSVIQGYSNKGHDGFLGCSVVGEWCNLGADSNTSNLKNNYAEVKLWDYGSAGFEPSGRQFLGLMMGDHSKCAINTMFNTGTLVGVSANIFGTGFPETFVPSFSWGGIHSFETFRLEKSLEVARKMMERRNLKLQDEDIEILQAVYHQSSRWRQWENE